MLRSWKLGRLAGIDLYLHPTFLLILALAYFSENGGMIGVGLTAAIFGCVVLHEYGHALTARLYGVRTRDITLYPIGGVARLERMPRSPGAELLITLAGPMVNVAIAAVLALGLWTAGQFAPEMRNGLVGVFASALLTINLILAGFNMLPAFPMDGGRILRALLSRPLGRLRATEVAASVGKVMALVIPVALTYAYGWANPMLFVLAVFVFLAGSAELRQVQAEEQARLQPVSVLPDDPGVRIAPPGYCWVNRGRGPNDWMLTPVVITISTQNAYPPSGASFPWRR
ncbi:MAG TPA: site-2 protease family protein [Isosphaeraceae bacterium]|nr:site-2 protease family protein [Isosphaeraceae bacterium]